MQNKKMIFNEINLFLKYLKIKIENKAKIVMSNREKNIYFCENYNIKPYDIKNILLNLNINDFCKILKNRNINKEEKLYLFTKKVQFTKFKKFIQLYIKINLIYNKNVIILVSFHQIKYYLKPMFRSYVHE